jgi:crotonobetainyl-CoA:carnitine CoA-transferase CaiB-like acyl-CoA transferase
MSAGRFGGQTGALRVDQAKWLAGAMDLPRLRVLDLTDPLGSSGARALLGLGAEVLRVASPTSSEGGSRAEDLHWQAGKRVVHAASASERRAVADRLVSRADIVLESGPVADLIGIEIAGDRPSSRWPGVIHVVTTPFGLTGPRRDWRADDLVLAAAGGMAWLGGRPEGQPKPPPREQALQLAGVHAAIGAMLALVACDRSGTGQLVDVSAQEAVAATLETAAIAWIHGGRYPRRTGGVYDHVAHRIFAASDGHVAGGYSGSPRMWTDLLAWLVDEGAAQDLVDSKWSDPATRWAGRAHVDEVVADFVASRTARQVAADGRTRALPWAEVVAPDQLRDNPQLTDRRFFVSIRGADLPFGAVEDVGFPFATPDMPRPIVLHEPVEVPAASASWTAERGRHTGAAPGPPFVDSPSWRPLEGLRVLDLTWVLAGPYATKTLADFGADVIKIESVHRQDPTRVAPGMRLRPGAGIDDSGYFINFNRNKRSVALNLRTDGGVQLLRRLAGECDVVIENFSPGMLERWGLTYEELAEERPSVIVVSMAGAGQTGPWRDAVTFADTLAAMSGLSFETRDPGGAPQGLTFGLGDIVAANAAILAVLDCVVARRGGYVDLSQLEAMSAGLGPAIVETQLGSPRTPATTEHPNRDSRWCPRGLYPTAGDDCWIAIAVTDQEMWTGLVGACPSLARWSSADLDERRSVEDEIDRGLADWTATADGAELAAKLQAAGVAAAMVNTGADLVERDEQLADRGFYVMAEHPIAGVVRHEGVVERLQVGAGQIRTSAPLLGEHTDEVLREAGFGDEEVSELIASGAAAGLSREPIAGSFMG